MKCKKCGETLYVDSFYNFCDKQQPIYYCMECLNFYYRIGSIEISTYDT